MNSRQRFVIHVDKREHRIEVEKQHVNAQQGRVIVDGIHFEVFAAPGGGFCVRAYDDPGQSLVHLDQVAWPQSAALAGHSVPLLVQTEQSAALTAAKHQASAHEGAIFSIRAPMPGRIIRIFIKNGQKVAQATPLLIVEAMKMENEIHAPGAGAIQKLAIIEGATVDAGQLLCEIDGQHEAT